MALRAHYIIAVYMAFHDSLMAEKFYIFVMLSLPDKQVKEAGMVPIKSVEEIINKAKEFLGAHPSTYIMPHGNEALPELKE